MVYKVSVELDMDTMADALELASDYEDEITFLEIENDEEAFTDVDEVDAEDCTEDEDDEDDEEEDE